MNTMKIRLGFTPSYSALCPTETPIERFLEFQAQMVSWESGFWFQSTDSYVLVKPEDLDWISQELAGWGLEVVSSASFRLTALAENE